MSVPPGYYLVILKRAPNTEFCLYLFKGHRVTVYQFSAKVASVLSIKEYLDFGMLIAGTVEEVYK